MDSSSEVEVGEKKVRRDSDALNATHADVRKVSYQEAVSRFSKRLSNLPCHHLEAQVDQLIPPLRLMRSPPHRILYEVLRITVAGCRRRTLDVKSGKKKQRGRGLEEMGIRHREYR